MSKLNFARAAVGLALIVVTTGAALASPRQKKASEPRAVREIRAVLDRQTECWNRRDLKGFMEGYWRSPELTFFSGGTETSGWDKTFARYRQRYQGLGNEMGRLDFTNLKVELFGDGAAFVRGRYHLKMASGDSGGLFTLTFRKLAGGWKIVHDHTSSS
ncbi:MAG: nuclear transport factor 2 family protein [Acidobacteriota bacterium]